MSFAIIRSIFGNRSKIYHVSSIGARGITMPVTPKQRQVYDFIARHIQVHQLPPTIAEIGGQFKMSSSASVHSILSALEREGLIKRIPNVSRGIELVEQQSSNGNDEGEVPL